MDRPSGFGVDYAENKVAREHIDPTKSIQTVSQEKPDMPTLPPLRRKFEPSTNPLSVLKGIGAGQGLDQSLPAPTPLNHHNQENLRVVRAEEEGDKEAATPGESKAKQRHPLVAMSDTGILNSTVESAKQIQQLASRLESIKSDLEKRENAINHKLAQWHKAVQTREQEYEQRNGQLHQQAAHVRIQQQHVLQLQHDIIHSHEASRSAIEAIVTEHTEGRDTEGLVRHLQVLKRELDFRFDYIARRWEQLHKLIENQRVAMTAEQSIDDRVWWSNPAH